MAEDKKMEIMLAQTSREETEEVLDFMKTLDPYEKKGVYGVHEGRKDGQGVSDGKAGSGSSVERPALCGAILPEWRWTHGNRERKGTARHNRGISGTAVLQYAGGDSVTPGECDNYSHGDAGGRTAAESCSINNTRYRRSEDGTIQAIRLVVNN